MQDLLQGLIAGPLEEMRYRSIVVPRALLIQDGNLRALRASLALEAGNLAEARAELRRIEAVCGPPRVGDVPVNASALALARLYRDWLDAAGK